MLRIELERLIYSKKIYFALGIITLMFLLNAVLKSIFTIPDDQSIYALYNTIVQFSFLMLPAILSSVFNDDMMKGHYVFFIQSGYNKNRYFYAKIVIYCFLIPLLYTAAFSVYLLVINQFKFESAVLLFLNITIITCLGALASLLFKKKTFAVFTMYIVFFIGDIVNLLRFSRGWLLQPDKGSVSTTYVANMYGATWDNKSIIVSEIPNIERIVCVLLIQIVILVLVTHLCFEVKEKRVL